MLPGQVMNHTRDIFAPLQPKDYLHEALAAFDFIESRKVATPHGSYWSLSDSKKQPLEYYDEISFYSGSTGVIHYYIQLAEATGEQRYLKLAEEGADYILYRWNNDRPLKKNFSPWAYSTGYAGVGYVLLELYLATKNARYREVVAEIGQEIIQAAQPSPDGIGYYWSGHLGAVADGSTILFLLHAGSELGEQAWVQFALKAGEIYLNKAVEYEHGGRYYVGVDVSFFGGRHPSHYMYPNFPFGSSGIGLVLLKLYSQSGDKRFLEATEGIEEFYSAIARRDENGAALAPYTLPDDGIYYLGFCHGPVGTSRFFYEHYRVTGDKRHEQWYKDLAEGIIAAGAPEFQSPGYWNIHSQCCGTAGILNLFLGIWAETGESKYLDYARRAGRQIIASSTHEHSDNCLHAKWFQAQSRVQPDVLSSDIGFYDGAAGIGSALLQLYLAETGQFRITRAIDDPFPARAKA